MNRQLPARPNLAQLKHQAKELLQQVRDGAEEAHSRFREHHPRSSDLAPLQQTDASLSDAQVVIAREYGFSSWTKLKRHVEGLEALEHRVSRLQTEFASGDTETRLRLLQPAHTSTRFKNYDTNAESLLDEDARLLIANQEGYAFWHKYESYLHLDPAVQAVIGAVRAGDLERLHSLLNADPETANPKWVPGFQAPSPIPNDSVPLFCISEAVARGTNTRGNEYEITRTLITAGAAIEIEGDLVLTAALSFHAVGVVEALLDSGAAVDGVDGDGVPMAYPMHFSDRELAELLAKRGAKLDLRFAAGLGRMDAVRNWFQKDGTLKQGAGALADPYGLERKLRGESPFRCERTRQNILNQAFYFACNNDRLETADFLLIQGAEINAIVPGLDFEATVLHRIASIACGRHSAWATPERLRTIIRFLLDRGASPSIRDLEYHSTPIGWAYYCHQDDVVDLLIDRAGIHDAVECDRIDRVRALLEQDASLANARDEFGQTPLHYLHSRLKHGVEIIDLLASRGAEVNARDSNGVSVLDHAANSEAAVLAEYLRSLGAA